MNQIISLDSFIGTVREKLTAASDYCKAHSNIILEIPAGIYVLEDARALQTMNEVLDGTYGDDPQSVMFEPGFPFSTGLDLDSCRNITINAYGAILMVHGFMEPVSIRNAKNITINGLTIDHVRKPFSEGTVVAVTDTYIDICFPKEYPMSTKAPLPRVAYFSATNKRLNFINFDLETVEEIAPQCIRFYGKYTPDFLGLRVYFGHTYHSRPAILVSHSMDVKLQDITIHSQPGMGIVGFKSQDIDIQRLHVVPSEGLYWSTNTDATHFACCSGRLTVENSTFAGHGDDAINVHNYYYTINNSIGNTCNVSVNTLTHSQEPDYPEAGYRLGLVRRTSLEPVDEYIVQQSSCENNARIVLNKPLPEDTENYLLANLTELPTLVFRGNHVRNHFARSVLIKTHNALVENCLFEDSTCTAIHVAAEANWHEGIASRNVTIRNNTFLRCGFTWNVSAVKIEIVADDSTAVGLHENICIEGNHVVGDGCTPIGFSISNARHGVIRNNVFSGFEKNIEIQYCDDIQCDDEPTN